MQRLTIALLFLIGCAAAQEPFACKVNVTQGQPWTVNTTQFNYIELGVQPAGQFPARLPWSIGIGADIQAIGPTDGWDISDASSEVIQGNVTEYWNVLTSDQPVNLGTIVGAYQASTDIQEILVQGQACSAGRIQTVSPVGKTEAALQPVSVSGTQLIGVDGKPLSLKGLNYFGFETAGGSMVDGLWGSSDSMVLDFATIVQRQALLGFNAVRLPFSFKNLFGGSLQSFTQYCNVDTQDSIVKATTDPSVNADISKAPLLPNPAPQTPGVCNSYLPNTSVLDRFLWVVRFYASNGIYVIVDNHSNLDSTVVENPTLWAQQWGMLAKMIAADPVASAYTVLDTLNEPDSQGIRWEASGGRPGLGDLYISAMDTIYSVNPQAVFLLEGTGQSGEAICW